MMIGEHAPECPIRILTREAEAAVVVGAAARAACHHVHFARVVGGEEPERAALGIRDGAKRVTARRAGLMAMPRRAPEAHPSRAVAHGLAPMPHDEPDAEERHAARGPAAEQHGTGRDVEGPVQAGDSVVIVEDVVTTGGSSLAAIEKAEAHGLKVLGVLAIIDRLEGGRETLAEHGYSLQTLLTIRDFGL